MTRNNHGMCMMKMFFSYVLFLFYCATGRAGEESCVVVLL